MAGATNIKFISAQTPAGGVRKILIGAVVLAVATRAAIAQQECAAPAAPAIPDGAKATPAQILATQTSLKAFAAASDNFQVCIAHEIERQKALAKEQSVDVDPVVQGTLIAKSAAQRQDAERLASAWGASVQAFTAAQQRRERESPPSVPPAMRGTMGMSTGGSAGNPY